MKKKSKFVFLKAYALHLIKLRELKKAHTYMWNVYFKIIPTITVYISVMKLLLLKYEKIYAEKNITASFLL